MEVFNTFLDWFSKLRLFDWVGLILFLSGLLGYRFFLAMMLRHRPETLFLGKLQQYRTAWIDSHLGSENNIVVVQTLRNTIMSASFLASTTVILIMGAFNLLHTIKSSGQPAEALAITGSTEPDVAVFMILLIIIILSYSFFNFTWYIREVNYMTFILNIPKDQLDAIEGGDSTQHVANMFLTSGIYFSLGMRGYYFLVPVLLWFFNPLLMIAATLVILYLMLRRDLAG